jgi:hypothetical protein
MQYLRPAPPKHKPSREIEFDIGDHVSLLTNPKWVGVVVAKSLSANVNVRWDDHGVEQVDCRLLNLVSAHA